MSPADTAFVQALVQLGQDNATAGNPQQALALFKEGVRLAPRDPVCNFLAGQTALTLGQAEAALPYLEVAIQEAPMEEAHWVAYIQGLIAVGAIETAANAIEFGVKFGLGVTKATQLAEDFVKSQANRAAQPTAPEIDFWSLPPAPPWPDPPLSQTADLSYITPPESKGRRYVIVSPIYRHNSAGIRVLHELQKWLIRAGYDALVITNLSGLDVAAFADDIAVYPEVVHGNPLGCPRVVRYILNHPGKIGGDLDYAPHELRVAYNCFLAGYAQGKLLQIPSTEAFFCPDDQPRTHTAYYVGKGRDLGMHPADAIAITSTHPRKRRELAQLLRSTRTLYTYDNFTMLAYEAHLCGCEVLNITPEGQIVPCTLADAPDRDEIKRQLHDFIMQSQALPADL
jgi:hypothetical protein